MREKGYLPHEVVKKVIFWVLTSCICFATVSGILGAWEIISEQAVNRALWSAFILAAGGLAFLGVNCAFGDLGRFIVSPPENDPNHHVEFSERLKKAKVTGSEKAGT